MKYDMNLDETHTIELCQTGEELFSAFVQLQRVNHPCDPEYKHFLEHRRFCQECKETPVSVGVNT